MKKTCLILCLILAFSILLSACGSAGTDDGGKGSETTLSTESSGGQTRETETEEETEPRVEPDIPKTKYDRTFNILHWTVGDAVWGDSWIPFNAFTAENYDGDQFNDAVYERNSLLQEQYGVDIQLTMRDVTEMATAVQNAVSTGDTGIDLFIQRGVQLNAVMSGGYFVNYQDIPYVNLDNPWWNQSSLKTLAFGNVYQFAASDFMILDKGATVGIVYNAVVADQNREATGDLYQAVKDKEWTFEKFVTICDTVAADLDADGTRISDGDLIAFTSGDDPVHAFYASSGLRFMDHDKNNYYFEYKFNSEESLDCIEGVFLDLMYADFYHNLGTHGQFSHNKFKANEQLFSLSFVKNAPSLRDMETDYGFLPVPMFYSDQDRYYTQITPHHDALMAVPTSAPDLEFVGVMLEWLGCESYYTTYPVFYDVVIEGRTLRDEQSKEMLRLMFETRVYDPGLIFDLKDFGTVVLRRTSTGSTGFASLWASNEAAIMAELDKLNDIVDNLNK